MDFEFHLKVIKSLPERLALDYLEKLVIGDNAESNASSRLIKLLSFIDSNSHIVTSKKNEHYQIFNMKSSLVLDVKFVNDFFGLEHRKIRKELLESGFTKSFRNSRDSSKVDYKQVRIRNSKILAIEIPYRTLEKFNYEHLLEVK